MNSYEKDMGRLLQFAESSEKRFEKLDKGVENIHRRLDDMVSASHQSPCQEVMELNTRVNSIWRTIAVICAGVCSFAGLVWAIVSTVREIQK